MTHKHSFVCTSCGQTHALNTRDWRCACGGLYDFDARQPFDPGSLDPKATGLWRYRRQLPLEPDWEPVSLGEGNTPLVQIEWQGRPLHLKMESLEPTGSFKDRGSAVMVTALRGLGIERVVEDSSGNAGASLSAYTARAGIACEVCVPASASGPKLTQMRTHGTEVIEIKGKREYAALAAWAAAAHGAYYASHVYSPYFLAGTETLAYELWEQLGQRLPAALILPVGNGSLLLGAYHGARRLLQAGLIRHLPRFFAIQAANCAPIHQAFDQGAEEVEPIVPEPTVAGGIAIAHPVRGQQILAAVRDTGGAVLSVTEPEIEETRHRLAHRGFYVERTSAVTLAAMAALASSLPRSAEEAVVAVVTGHGLKCQPGSS